jgi:sugar phosphate isomerase/epimerase
MKILLGTHALRGYPPRIGGPPSAEVQRRLIRWAKREGFAGLEVGDWWLNIYKAKREEVGRLADDLRENGLELAGFNCLRKCVTHPAVAEQNKQDLRHAVELAGRVRANFVSVSLSLDPSVSGSTEDKIKGLQTSPGGGRSACDEEFAQAGAFLRDLAEAGSAIGVKVAIELHHCSIADTSQRVLRLLELARHPNLSVNPDLVNLYWAYALPEEPWYQALEWLADRVHCWHVKNVQRVFLPEVHRARFLPASLDAGDIDYRWALGRLLDAGFDGYISIEGAGPGDLLAYAAKGKNYLESLLREHISHGGIRIQ